MKNLVWFIIPVISFFIISCEEPVILETKGSISGTVTDAVTHSPLESANVSITGKSFVTGADGTFVFNDLPEGNYTVSFSKLGYSSEKKQYSVMAGKATIADISLHPEYAEVSLSTNSLDFGTTLDKLTFEIIKPDKSNSIEWFIEKQSNANWLSFSETAGTMTTPKLTITVYLLRNELTEDKIYTTELLVNVKNGGSEKITITAQRKSAQLAADPASLDFGSSESEKTVLLTNATQEGVLNYKASGTESWIALENAEGTITNTDVATLKVKVNRVNLAAGGFSGSVIITSNKNTVTVPVSMQVLGQQRPDIGSIQCTQVKYSSFEASAYISSVGSAAVTAYGFCWSSTNTQPTTSDNKNNLGGTTVAKSFNSTITGLTPQTTYYIRGYATNEVGTTYTSPLTVKTLTAPTYAVVKTLAPVKVEHDSATIKGSIEDLGDGYVTSYGFCYSTTNPNPTLADASSSYGSTVSKGEFEGEITGLAPKTKYYVRAYATNSVGTAYGGAVQITTTAQPPVVTSGLLAYYTFDEQNCDDYFGEIDYCGVYQGSSGDDVTFVEDTPSGEGYSLKGSNNGKWYQLLVAPDYNQPVVTYSVWLKTKSTNTGWVYEQNYSSSYGRGIRFYNGYLAWSRYNSSSWNYFGGTGLQNLLLNGEWHHMALIWKNSDHKLYIDGRFILSSSSTSASSNYYYKGKVSWLGLHTGLMDNMRIYNRALSKEEITEIYDAKQ